MRIGGMIDGRHGSEQWKWNDGKKIEEKMKENLNGIQTTKNTLWSCHSFYCFCVSLNDLSSVEPQN